MTKKLLVSSIIFLILYFLIAFSVIFKLSWVKDFDLYVISFIQSFITDTRTNLIINLTDFAGTFSIIILTTIIVVLFFSKRMYILGIWFGFTVFLGPGVLVFLMKQIIGRNRPEILRLAHETTHSFPSGHSTAATVLCGFLGLLIIFRLQSKFKKYLSGVIVFLLILFIMFSRVYLGVHFPTDVLAGFSFGMAMILLSLALYKLLLENLKSTLHSRKIKDNSPHI